MDAVLATYEMQHSRGSCSADEVVVVAMSWETL